MIPLSMETMFLILSGVILAAGVLYWFWSHIQLMQKKVQLLENAVFELRGMFGSGPGGKEADNPGLEPIGQPAATYRDLDDDDWKDTVEQSDSNVMSRVIPNVMTSVDVMEPLGLMNPESAAPMVSNAMTPIGLATPNGNPEVIVTREEPEQFRELFIQEEAPAKTVVAADQTLEGLPLKELRRIATERGITGAAEMKKKEVIAALRNSVNEMTAIDVPVLE